MSKHIQINNKNTADNILKFYSLAYDLLSKNIVGGIRYIVKKQFNMNKIKIYEASKIMWNAIKNEELINSLPKKLIPKSKKKHMRFKKHTSLLLITSILVIK